MLLTVKITVRVTNFLLMKDSDCQEAVVCDTEVYTRLMSLVRFDLWENDDELGEASVVDYDELTEVSEVGVAD